MTTRYVKVPLDNGAYPDDFTDTLNGYITGGSTRTADALRALEVVLPEDVVFDPNDALFDFLDRLCEVLPVDAGRYLNAHYARGTGAVEVEAICEMLSRVGDYAQGSIDVLKDMVETAHRRLDEARVEAAKADDEALQLKTARHWALSNEQKDVMAVVYAWKHRAEAAEAILREHGIDEPPPEPASSEAILAAMRECSSVSSNGLITFDIRPILRAFDIRVPKAPA